jgi:regulator of ribonuclease activity A
MDEREGQPMDFKTADLCDEFEQSVEVAEPLLRDYGGTTSFYGSLATVKVFEDNVLVREALETAGQGRVLVVDGGGSTRCALVGDQLAHLAYENGWAGIIVDGCIRDSDGSPASPSG